MAAQGDEQLWVSPCLQEAARDGTVRMQVQEQGGTDWSSGAAQQCFMHICVCLPVRNGMTSVPPPGAVITREFARLQIQGGMTAQAVADRQGHTGASASPIQNCIDE